MPPSLGAGAALRRPVTATLVDLAMPAAILLAVLVVLAPVPAPLVDTLLAANLTVSVLALLGALAARTPQELSIFPTFLLGATLVRLVLNIATTRLILSRAAIDGPAAAGRVVEAFGEFVAANNLVVGAVIFAIIAVVQFVVITAGSTRTSEVAARFALDGLPGRQMAIDTDVQNGTLTRAEARGLRLELQRQADFFASMDGASRFIAGEAVASVIITLVNIVGGLAIGVLERGMPLGRALDLYSRLTIGDGLSSAVPSLLVSVATGLLISRSSQAIDLPREFTRQFTAKPQVLAITGVFLALLSVTDLPFLPLASMAALAFLGAFVTSRRGRSGAPAADTVDAGPRSADMAKPLAAVLADERIVVELGAGLVPLVAAAAGPLPARAAALRQQIAADLGIVMPAVGFRDDLRLPARSFVVSIAGTVVQRGDIPAGRLLVVAAPGAALDLPGDDAVDPLTGRTAVWAGHSAAEIAGRHDATVLDEAAMVVRAIEAAVRQQADRLLSREAVSQLLETLREQQPALVEQVVPSVLSVAKIQRTLQCLVREGVPVRPLADLLEIMSDHAADAAEPWQLAEIVRRRLAALICRRACDPQGRLTAVRLSAAGVAALLGPAAPGREQQPTGRGSQAASRIAAEIRRAVRPAVERGGAAVVVVPTADRRGLHEALIRQLPGIRVLAEEEVADEAGLEIFATLGPPDAARAA
jgi:flagellar biosynthesis protein FlhA